MMRCFVEPWWIFVFFVFQKDAQVHIATATTTGFVLVAPLRFSSVDDVVHPQHQVSCSGETLIAFRTRLCIRLSGWEYGQTFMQAAQSVPMTFQYR